MRFAHLLTVLVCAITCVAQPPALRLQPQKVAISLDGRLDDADWSRSARVHLTQQSPVAGGSTPYVTDVRVLLGEDSIYLGFDCQDPDPRSIAVHTMRRDGDMSGDDTISIALDTFGDHRTGYYFRVNAAGARVDGLISDPESVSLDWDGVWEARTARDAHGWTAEIKIPARTLSFSRQRTDWGINFERFIPRDRTTLRWTSATLDSFFYDLSRTGFLHGGEHMDQGRGFEISPYGTARTAERFRPGDRNYQAALGGDVSWRITPQLQSVFTINTDFAETEVDARQVNLTRFPLFFPEKRSFFLEGANQFQFGLGLGSNFIPFFSRRIGLFAGAQVPILAGVKVNGRVGNWNLGLLDVQTRDAATPAGRISGTNLLAGRVSYDVTPKLRIGTVFTHGDPGAGRDRPLAGFDAVYRTSTFMGNKNFLVGAWTASSYNSGKDLGSSTGWGYKVDYPNDLFDCSHTFSHFGKSLDPALGFLPRPGTERLTVGCDWQPRPSKDGPFRWIRQEFFENSFTRVSNAKGFLESWEYFMAPINVRLETGDRFEFNWVPTYEFLDQPFEISSGVFIPPGRYNFTRWRLEAQTSPHRAFQFGHTTWFGTFYDGHLTEWENYLNWTSPQGRVQFGLSTTNNFGRLPAGNFAQRLWQLQSAYAWNPDLILTSFIQYDSESRNLGSNTRLRWTPKPGNDVFLIWNRSWESPIGRRELSLLPENDLVALKIRWTFRY